MLHLRLADNIKMDIVDVGCDMGDWIYLDLGGVWHLCSGGSSVMVTELSYHKLYFRQVKKITQFCHVN